MGSMRGIFGILVKLLLGFMKGVLTVANVKDLRAVDLPATVTVNGSRKGLLNYGTTVLKSP